MKVKKLKKLIKDLDDELILICSSGDDYSPLEGIDVGDFLYIPENTYSGEVISGSEDPSEYDMDEEEWEKYKKDNIKCAILYSVN